MNEFLSTSHEADNHILPKVEREKLRETIRSDARNRTDYIRELREVLKIESSIDPDFKKAIIIPDREKSNEFHVVTPGKLSFTIVLPSTKNSPLGNSSIPFFGRIATIHNLNNDTKYGLQMIEPLGSIEEIIVTFIKMESMKRSREKKGEKVFFNQVTGNLEDSSGMTLVNFDMLPLSSSLVRKIMIAWQYLLDPSVKRVLRWDESA